MHVFWEKGYEGASMHDLTTAMGIQPASLYAAFGNKQAMFERTLDHYLAGPAAFMSAALEEPTAYAVAERILRQTAEALTARRARYGCMTIQAALVGRRGAPFIARRAALSKRQGRVVTGEQVAKALLEAVLTSKTGTHIIESENLRNV